jgi:hypothetical protein
MVIPPECPEDLVKALNYKPLSVTRCPGAPSCSKAGGGKEARIGLDYLVLPTVGAQTSEGRGTS